MSIAARKQPKRLVAALVAGLGILGLQSAALASVLSVTSCADDGTTGTLRQVAAQALHGDTIDLSGLSCIGSTITLSQGEIALPYNVTINGPAAGTLSVSAAASRVFNSTSADQPAYLKIQNLNIAAGSAHSAADDVAGGCIRATGTVTLSNSNVQNCSASSDSGSARGGAIYAASVNLVSSRVSSSDANAAAPGTIARGGGIYVTGQLYCKDSTISGNSALAAAGSNAANGGGALLANADLRMYRCTVDGNAADQGAGLSQIVMYGPHQTTLIANSTISGNVAGSAYTAGGVNVFCADCAPAQVSIYNSTVAFNRNQGSYAAGVYTNGAIAAQSSIIANNTGAGGVGGDTFAKQLSGANNLVMVSNVADAGAVASTADPALQALADNGGATRTHAPTASSPALRAGNDTLSYSTDQRGAGYARVVGGVIDIGAVQSQSGARAASDAIFAGTFNN